MARQFFVVSLFVLLKRGDSVCLSVVLDNVFLKLIISWKMVYKHQRNGLFIWTKSMFYYFFHSFVSSSSSCFWSYSWSRAIESLFSYLFRRVDFYEKKWRSIDPAGLEIATFFSSSDFCRWHRSVVFPFRRGSRRSSRVHTPKHADPSCIWRRTGRWSWRSATISKSVSRSRNKLSAHNWNWCN